jgi:hypothetical protein
MSSYNISHLPDDLPPGKYDITVDNVRWVPTRDGELDLVFETTFRGPHDSADPTLLHFKKEDPDGRE